MRTIGFVLGLGCVALLGAGAGWAVTANPECVQDARAEKKACFSTCRDDFHVAKDLCRNVNHECADACRAGRSTCVAVPLGELETCKAVCQADLDAAKADCRLLYPGPENAVQRDQCIDAAQLEAFQCRDICRESVDRETLKLCRQAFRSCIRACPPAAAE